MRTLFIIAVVGICSFSSFAQSFRQATVENIDVKYSGGQTEVTFQITGGKLTAAYEVTLELLSEGKKLNAKTLSGDVGSGISSGATRTIRWNQLKDGYVLDNFVKAIISIRPQPELKAGKAIVKSLFLPGLGDYQLRKKKHYFVYTLGTLGALGTGTYFFIQSNSTYNRYKSATEIAPNDNLFKQANTERYISYALFGTAVVIWAADLIALKVKANKLKRQSKFIDGNYYLEPNYNVLPTVAHSGTFRINTKTPYDLALERGDSYFSSKDYKSAKEAYQEAKKLKPNELVPKVKLEELELELQALAAIDAEYKKLVMDGDNLRSANNPAAAKIKYKQAIATGRMDVTTAEAGLQVIKGKEEEAEKNLKYTELLASAVSAENAGNWAEAKSLYDQAVKLFPNRQHPQNKSTEIAEKLDRITSSAYKKKMADAEIALENREYTRAKMIFEDASKLRPEEDYPKQRISSINSILAEASASNNLPDLFKKCKDAVFYVIFAEKKGVSFGSGFFISDNGVGVSNYHVFKGNAKGSETILTEDGSEYSVAEVLDSDEDLDYIIFRVRQKNFGEKFPFVKVSKQTPAVGQRVFAIGNPKGLEKSLSDGIVSGFRGDFKERIQITAPITHGSSGGPLFDMNGEVIGITTGGLDAGNLNYAMDIQKLRLSRFTSGGTGKW